MKSQIIFKVILVISGWGISYKIAPRAPIQYKDDILPV